MLPNGGGVITQEALSDQFKLGFNHRRYRLVERILKAAGEHCDVFINMPIKDDGPTALMRSVQVEDNAFVKLLLRFGADPLWPENGSSPLLYCLEVGDNRRFFQLLPHIDAEANTWSRDLYKKVKLKIKRQNRILYNELSAFRKLVLKKGTIQKVFDAIKEKPLLLFYPLTDYGHTLLHYFAINYQDVRFGSSFPQLMQCARSVLSYVRFKQLFEKKDNFGLSVKDYMAMHQLKPEVYLFIDPAFVGVMSPSEACIKQICEVNRHSKGKGSPLSLALEFGMFYSEFPVQEVADCIVDDGYFSSGLSSNDLIDACLSQEQFKKALLKDHAFLISFIDALSNEQLNDFEAQILEILCVKKRAGHFAPSHESYMKNIIKIHDAIGRCYHHGFLGFPRDLNKALKYYEKGLKSPWAGQSDCHYSAIEIALDLNKTDKARALLKHFNKQYPFSTVYSKEAGHFIEKAFYLAPLSERLAIIQTEDAKDADGAAHHSLLGH